MGATGDGRSAVVAVPVNGHQRGAGPPSGGCGRREPQVLNEFAAQTIRVAGVARGAWRLGGGVGVCAPPGARAAGVRPSRPLAPWRAPASYTKPIVLAQRTTRSDGARGVCARVGL